MPPLDLFTLNCITILNVMLAGTALLVVSRLNRACPGLKRCVAACGLLVVGFGLFPARAFLPGNAAILLSNLPLFASCMLLLDGIRAFRHLPRPVGLYAAMAAAYLGLFGWFLFVHENTMARVVVTDVFMSTVAMMTAWAMASKSDFRDRAVYWSTAAGFALHGVSLLVRAFFALTDAGSYGTVRFVLSHPIPMDFVNIVTLNVTALGCAFGLSMATNLQLQRRTEVMALYDSLTNLPNRRLFEERLETAERRAAELRQRIALIYCDLDGFKGINDTLGHAGGDGALRTVAERLRGLLSADVCLARIGGDEFVALIENAPSREGMESLMRRLRNGVEGEVRLAGKMVTLRISCGMAIYPDDVGNASDLIRLADAGMYQMKQRARHEAVPETSRAG